MPVFRMNSKRRDNRKRESAKRRSKQSWPLSLIQSSRTKSNRSDKKMKRCFAISITNFRERSKTRSANDASKKNKRLR